MPGSTTIDPSRDAAGLLRRLGFAALALGVPCAAYAGPSGAVIAAALGLVLTGGAAALDGDRRLARPGDLPPAAAVALGAGALLVGWAALSLLWTPAPRAAAERLAALAAVAALGLAGILALPARVRAANLYLVPVGAAAGAAIGLALAIGGGPSDVEARRLERGLAVAALLAWPAIAWLRSRGRDLEAVGLALLAAVATAAAPTGMPIGALGAGAVAYLVVQAGGPRGAAAVGALAAGAALLAPAALALLDASGFDPARDGLGGWRALLLDEPWRLVTGRGYDALPRDGSLGARLPGAPILALWYDLGIVGAASLAAALTAGAGAFAARPTLGPGIAAGFATACVLSLSPAAVGQPWWVAALAVAALAFAAAERSQFRTRRPRIAFSRGRTA